MTRKDIVSLAHVAKLDWNQVPKSNQWMKYAIIAGIAIVVILGVIFGVKHLKSDPDNNGGVTPSTTEQVDSVAIKQKEVARQDSIKNVERQDSIKRATEKVRQDSIKSKKKPTQPKKESKKKGEDKSKDNKGKDKSSQTKKRAIG